MDYPSDVVFNDQLTIDSPPDQPMDTDLEQSLLSFERMDRNSPDLWPEQIPGVSSFACNITPDATPPAWLETVNKEDPNMLHEFAWLSPTQLVEKVRGLQELAFQLGLEEAHEMVRAKFLNILSRPSKKT